MALRCLVGKTETPNQYNQGDGEKMSDELSHYDYRAILAAGPRNTESGTEGGDESDFGAEVACPSGNTGPSSFAGPSTGHELSGQSRTILRHFFDKAPHFRFILGHPTIAFTEPQLHHLLRKLTDETVSYSFTTMEQDGFGSSTWNFGNCFIPNRSFQEYN